MKLYACTISRQPLIRREFSSQIYINTKPNELKNRLLYQRYYSKTIHSTSFRFSLNMPVQYTASFFGQWRTQRSWRTDLLNVVIWRGVDAYLLETSLTKSSVRTEAERTLNQTRRYRCASESLLEWQTDWRTYVLTYLGTYYLYFLTYSMEQRPASKDNRFSASQEMPRIYGTRRFITAFTRARHRVLSEPKQSSPCPQIPLPEHPS
jgi:hypothetical protein